MNNYKEKYEDMFNRLNNLLDNTKKQGRIIASVEDIEATFPELKESEDERIIKRINSLLYSQCKIHGSEYEEIHKWLKFLKDRVGCEVNCTTTWKPSEEQMRALSFAIKKIDTNTEVGEYRRDLLEELIEQLKKLREK